MQFEKIAATSSLIVASAAMAEQAQKSVDLSKLYALFEHSGYSSLGLMETTKHVFISSVAVDVSQSFNGNPILIAGASVNSKALAQLTTADDAQENKLQVLEVGKKSRPFVI